MPQTITSEAQFGEVKGNTIVGYANLIRSKIVFQGKGNVIIFQSVKNAANNAAVKLTDTKITFTGDNNVVFLDANGYYYALELEMFRDSFCYIGSNNCFNGVMKMQCSERSNIIIGNGCMFSFNIWLRTNDVHLIYDTNSHKRINPSRSIFIGDHCWIGQDARILKGTAIGSGAILGAGTVAAGKWIPSNSSWAGNPARLIKNDVFFSGNSSHMFTEEDSEKWSEYPGDEFIYQFDEDETIPFQQLEQKILSFSTASERAKFMMRFSREKAKNRFYIGAE